jgi:1-acyl-sn-glycerol-3-phosphate acyltransferase
MGYLLVFVRTLAVCAVYPGFAIIGLVLRLAGFISKKRRHTLLAWFTHLWARCSCILFNIRIEVDGDVRISSGSLIVANHIGTPDIFVLGACFPGFFVSKAEIAEWPVFNLLARLGEVIFAERNKRHQVKEIIQQMGSRLEEGCSVILFPEGQATDGRTVLDFKPSTFEAAVRTGSDVVPITLIYRDGPQPSIACWFEMTFFQHILRLLKNPRLDVTVFVHTPVKGEKDRRVLAEKSLKIIRDTHAREINGQGSHK